MSEVEGQFRIMGKVVDNTEIDLSRCSFPFPVYPGYAGEQSYLTVLVRNGRRQPLSDTALKISSIPIWATRIEGAFSPAAPVLVPISGYSKGEVHALVQFSCSQTTAFLLELLLDIPCILPDFQSGSLASIVDRYFPLKTWLLMYKSRASDFDVDLCSPKECVKLGVRMCTFTNAFLYTEISQVKNGVATVRAIEPVQDRDFGVSIIILKCITRKLDIGFTWGFAENSQEMKLVLASAANSNSSSCPICDVVAGDLIHITRCPYTQDKYNIDHYVIDSGLLKNNHNVRIDLNTKPILMVRMFRCGTCIQVYEHNTEQRNKFMREAKSPF